MMGAFTNFKHNQILESMLTFATWQGGFSSADKEAMKDALQTIRTAMVQAFGANANAKRRSAKCVTDVEFDCAVMTVLCTAMCLWLSGELDAIETKED